MAVVNSTLIDAAGGVFSVLGVVSIRLFSSYRWNGKDIDYPEARGSVFYAYEDPPTVSVASISVVDISGDDSEPDISLIQSNDVPAIDMILKSSISKQMNVIRWMSSHLNEANGHKGLVTAYITASQNAEWQYIAIRTNHFGRRYVIVGMFDVAKATPLAKLVSDSLGSVSFKPF